MSSKQAPQRRRKANENPDAAAASATGAAPPKQPCCTKAPSVVSNYKPKGNEVVGKIRWSPDLTIYESPFDANRKPTKLIICAYDIFGLHPNTKEVCDNLALASGARVIMPDFYRGDYWSEDRNIQLMFSWVTYHGSWDTIVKTDIHNILDEYKTKEGITSVGIFGFCWGGKISVLAGIEILDISAAGLIHPSGVLIQEADKIKCPAIVCPSGDEINFLPFKVKVEERLGQGKAEHYRYDNMHHGFCAARGKFDDPANRTAVDEIIGHLAAFFNKHL